VVTYDRGDLIRARSTRCGDTLIEEMVVVSLVIFAVPAPRARALVPILTLPARGGARVHPDVRPGLTANIMSLGGIAVAIGAMVDASIILIENVHKARGLGTAGRPASRTRRRRARDAGGRTERSSSRCS
jgi:Cu(I)/Ag(I) efflux system membrane protein CusA/SilA